VRAVENTAASTEDESTTIGSEGLAEIVTTSVKDAAIQGSTVQEREAVTQVQDNTTPKATPNAGHARRDTRTAVPIIPVVPGQSSTQQQRSTSSQQDERIDTAVASAPVALLGEAQIQEQPHDASEQDTTNVEASNAAPKSWADLVRSKNLNKAAASSLTNGTNVPNGIPTSRAGTMSDVLSHYSVENGEKVAFLEPRGLVNTGNMCYMNAVSFDYIAYLVYTCSR